MHHIFKATLTALFLNVCTSTFSAINALGLCLQKNLTYTVLLLLLISGSSFAGAVNNSLDFDGSGDYVTLTNESAFDFSSSFSVGAWMRSDGFNTAHEALVVKGDKAWRMQRHYATDYAACAINDGASSSEFVTSATNVNDGAWHYIVCTFDQSTLKIYVDGGLESRVASTAAIGNNNYAVGIGENFDSSDRVFDGRLDEVAIWSNALDSGEVAGLYNSGSPISAASDTGDYKSSTTLVGYYSMDSNSGAGAVLTDDSGNSNSGTITKATWSLDVPPDIIAPKASSVSSDKVGGSYKAGEVIDIDVNFPEVVIVTGTPQITLETGSTDQVVNYSSGSGTSTLTFNYTVQAGDTASDLGYTSTAALALNSGSIRDSAGNDATLTLASPGTSNSLAYNEALIIDTTAPTISSVTSSWGDYLTEVEDNANGTVTVVTSSAENGQTVTLTLNGADYTANVSSNSTSITVTAAGLQALSNNTTYTLTTNVSDAVGNAATAYTSTTFKALNNPSANNALEFDGTNDYVTIPDNSALDITGDITLEAWVKFDDLTGSQIILEKSDGGASADFSYGLRMFSSKIRFQLGNGDASVVLTAPNDAPIGEWFHISGVNSSGSMTLYINGVSVATGTITGNIYTNNDSLIIGNYDGFSQYFDGQIDEVRIWNDARTQSEILANMANELNGGEGGLVAYYKFNEPDTNTVASNFASATGATYDGTLTNMTGTEWLTSTAFGADITAPTVTSFTSTTTDGSFKQGDTINITANTSENIVSGNALTVTLDTTETVLLTAAANGTTLVGTYTVGAGVTSSDLTVSSFVIGTVTDAAGNAMASTTVPGTNIATGSALIIDTTAPTISSVTATWGAYLTEVEDNATGTVTVVTSGAEDGQAVTFTLNGADYTANVSSNSTSITVTTAGLQALSNNTTYTLTTNVSDAVGNAATAHTSTSFRALNNPTVNNALDFDGTDDFVSLGDVHDSLSSLTFEAWIYPDTSTDGVILSKNLVYAFQRRSSGKLEIYFGDGYNWNGTPLVSTDTVPSGQWSHVAVTRDSGNNVVLYINGVASSAARTISESGANAIAMAIGAYEAGQIPFDGKMDEVRIWNDARTQSEISANMTSELNGNESNLVAYYKFNEPDTNTVASNFASATGASYDGTLTNMLGTEWLTSTAFGADTTAPTVTSFTSTTSDGSFKQGGSINITANTSENIVSGNTLTVTLDTTETVLLTAAANGTTLVGTYTVGAGVTSSDLTVSSFVIGTVADTAGNAMTSTTVPGTNIASGSALVVDTTSPIITSNSGGTTAAINTAENTTAVTTVVATDTNTRTYTISGGADQAKFDIPSGALSFKTAPNFESPTDSDTNNTYVVEVTATDVAGNTDVQTITVTVTDATESATFTIDAISDVSVAENAAYTGVTPATSGATPIGSLTYALSGTDAADFTINTSTGVVSMVARDYEIPADSDTNNIYSLTINATDSDGNTASEAWLVTVTDVDENKPTVTFSPLDGVSAVAANSNITITFNEVVRLVDDTDLSDTNVDALITLKATNASGADIAFDATINDGKTVITITPTSDFSSEQVAYVAIGATVEDTLGNANNAAHAIFTVIDTIAPTITFSPVNAATSIDIDANITLSFDEVIRNTDNTPLTSDNVDALITLKATDSSGADIAFEATINTDKTLITINPSNDFSASQVVFVAIGTTVEDGANNAITAANATFTVTSVTDSVPPTMAITAIEVNDGGASDNATLALRFTSSEATTNFALSDITVSNAALSSFSATSSTVYTATLTPTAEGAVTVDVAAGTFTDAASNNNTAATQFNWIYLVDPTTKVDVTGSIKASINMASQWTQSTFSTISNRLGWLKSHKGQSKTSYQGIRLDFNDATINTLMAAPSASFFDTNWTNAAVDHANRSNDSLSTLGRNVVMDASKAALNEAAIVRQNATGTLNPAFKPIYNGWSIWTDGTVTIGDVDATATSAKQSSKDYSISIGLDKPLNANRLVGFVLRTGQGSVDVGTSTSKVKSESYSLAGYSAYEGYKNLLMEAVAGVGVVKYNLTRADGVHILNGARAAHQAFASFSASKPATVFGKLSLSPFVKATYNHTSFGVYSESGGSTALTYKEHAINETQLALGTDVRYQLFIGNNDVHPYARMSYSLDVSDQANAPAQMYYNSNPSKVYSLALDTRSTASVKFALGADLITMGGIHASLSYLRNTVINLGHSQSVSLRIGQAF